MSQDWLTAAEVFRDYGIRLTTLHYWSSTGWRALGGQKPRRMRAPLNGRKRGQAGRGATVYHRQDVARIASAVSPAALVADEAGAWLTNRPAEERYGRPHLFLGRWRRTPCPWLGGRPIRARRVVATFAGPRGERRARLWLYHAEDVARVVQAQPESLPVHPDWIPAIEARRQVGFSKHALLHWRVQGCVHLGGRKVRARRDKVMLPHFRPPVPRACWVYGRADLDAIAARLTVPRGAALSDAEGDWLCATEAARVLGVWPGQMSYWRKRAFPSLPAGKIRAKQIPCPPDKPSGKARARIWVYHAGDLARAATEPDGRTREGRALRSGRGPARRPLEGAAGSAQASDEGDARRPRLRPGPAPDPDTEAMSACCCREYVTNRRSRTEAWKIVKQQFPDNAPSCPDDVKVYARRYATRHNLPWRQGGTG